MKPVPRQLRPWAWAMLAAALLGWLLAPALPEAASLVQARRDEWRLPPLQRVDDQTLLAAQAMSAPYWGAAPAPAAQASAADPGWRIAAIFGLQSQRQVLLLARQEGLQPLRLGVGDRLPDGRRIIAIGTRDITVSQGPRQQRLEVERSAN